MGGAALCLASAAAFGAMGIFGRLAYEDGATVGTLLAVRFALAAALFWALVVASGSAAELRKVGRRDLVAALALGGGIYAAQAGGYFAALERVDPSLLALLLYTFPAIVALAAIALGRERADRRRMAALGLVSGGLVLVLASSGAASGDPLGAALGLATAVVYSVYILAGEGIARRVPPLVLSALVCTAAAVSLTAGSALLGELRPGRLTLSGWAWIACLAVVCTVVALSLFFAGLRRVGPDDRRDPLHPRAGRDRGARLRRVRRRAGRRPAARRLRRPRRRARASGADAHRVAGEAAPPAYSRAWPPSTPTSPSAAMRVAAGCRRCHRHAARMNVTIWNEFVGERSKPEAAQIYPDGIHATLADALSDVGKVRTATLSEPEHGLPADVLDTTDVLVWWGHDAHEDVADDIVDRVVDRVHDGMGLVVLHSGHYSKPFRRLMGTRCTLEWRHDDRETVWTVAPGHPIAAGIPSSFVIPEQEMYGEFFDVPPPRSWSSSARSAAARCSAAAAAGRAVAGASSTSAPATRPIRSTTSRRSGG